MVSAKRGERFQKNGTIPHAFSFLLLARMEHEFLIYNLRSFFFFAGGFLLHRAEDAHLRLHRRLARSHRGIPLIRSAGERKISP